jgi:hypothetical protein
MQNLNMKLHVVFCTTNLPRSIAMVEQMRRVIKDIELSFSALIIGSSNKEHNENIDCGINIIKICDQYLPINESRNICQGYLKNEMESQGGLGMILDDDLEWFMPETDFVKLLEDLNNKDCDMAFMPVVGDAPIPKEYVRASALLDILLAIKSDADTCAINEYLLDVTTDDDTKVEYHHHDYYSYKKIGFNVNRICLNDFCFNDFIESLYTGKSTTRHPLHSNEITVATGRERGPATIVFNSTVLNYKNIAISHPPYHSRRSDMMMALQARYNGYKLFNTPAVLKHNRQEEFDSHDPKKLIGDILGYALIESFDGSSCDFEKFILHTTQRKNKTLEIIRDTSSMLKVLAGWIDEQGQSTNRSQHLIENIIIENEKITSIFDSFDLYSTHDLFKNNELCV